MKLFSFGRQIITDEVKMFIKRVTRLKFNCKLVFDKWFKGAFVSMIKARGCSLLIWKGSA